MVERNPDRNLMRIAVGRKLSIIPVMDDVTKIHVLDMVAANGTRSPYGRMGAAELWSVARRRREASHGTPGMAAGHQKRRRESP
jgi:hypothetical protein